LSNISSTVRDFIGTYITSVDELEILLLLRQTPRKSLGSLAISKALQLDQRIAEIRLDRLSASGLIRATEIGNEKVYEYRPESRPTEWAIAELAEVYPQFRVRIISLIYSRSLPA
jgi:hypothetical protein